MDVAHDVGDLVRIRKKKQNKFSPNKTCLVNVISPLLKKSLLLYYFIEK